jgi:hypothetical protein
MPSAKQAAWTNERINQSNIDLTKVIISFRTIVLRYSSEDHAFAATRGPCGWNYSPSLPVEFSGVQFGRSPQPDRTCFLGAGNRLLTWIQRPSVPFTRTSEKPYFLQFCTQSIHSDTTLHYSKYYYYFSNNDELLND